MSLADRANQYVDQHKPWALAKDPARAAEVIGIATQGINLFRVLMSALAPVLPQMADAASRFLGCRFDDWQQVAVPLLGSTLPPYQPLATRLDPAAVAQLVDSAAPAAPAAPAASPAATAPGAGPAIGQPVGIADFQKLDLRIARIVAATLVEGSDKLLQLTLDLGGERRNVLSGIRAAYDPATLVGRQVLMVANLEPRKMRFGVSEGMVLCASGSATDGERALFLLSPDSGAQPGMKVT
jgi:methionyl-tRNA synthetase